MVGQYLLVERLQLNSLFQAQLHPNQSFLNNALAYRRVLSFQNVIKGLPQFFFILSEGIVFLLTLVSYQQQKVWHILKPKVQTVCSVTAYLLSRIHFARSKDNMFLRYNSVS